MKKKRRKKKKPLVVVDEPARVEKTYDFDGMVDLIEDFYRDVDTKLTAHIEKGISEWGSISCHSCTEPACCRQKVTMSVMEALPIARLIKNTGRDTPELRARLKDLGDLMEGFPTARWLDEYIPCVFLEDDKCTIYPVRPTRCRTYWVISPPESCRPPSGQTVRFVNDTPAIDASITKSHEVHLSIGLKENGFRILRGAMPRVLLIVLEAWDSDDYRKSIRNRKWPSVRNIERWLNGDNVFSEKDTAEEDAAATVQ